MSDFIIVIPEGWIQLDWQYITNNLPNMSMASVMDQTNSGSYAGIEEALKTAGIVAPESTLVGAKLIDDTYFMIMLG